MSVHLNTRSFFSKYIADPCSNKLTMKEKAAAVILSATLTILTLGTIFIAYYCLRNKKIKQNPDTKGARKVDSFYHKEKPSKIDKRDENKNFKNVGIETRLNPNDNAIDSSSPPKNTKPIEIITRYRKEAGIFTEHNCLELDEKAKIDNLLSHFQEKSTLLAVEFPKMTSIRFYFTKYPDTRTLKLQVYLALTPKSKEISTFEFEMSPIELETSSISDKLSSEIEEKIRSAKNYCDLMVEQLESTINSKTILETFKKQSDKYQLKLKNVNLEMKHMYLSYHSASETLTFESLSLKFVCKWYDGQMHSWYSEKWDDFKEQYISLLLGTINCEKNENIAVSLLTFLEKKFDQDIKELHERSVERISFEWDWSNFFNDTPTADTSGSFSGELEAIKYTLLELQKSLLPDSEVFSELPVTAENLDEIKRIVKEKFKLHIRKYHPDKAPDKQEECRQIIKLYRNLEKHYQARKLDW